MSVSRVVSACWVASPPWDVFRAKFRLQSLVAAWYLGFLYLPDVTITPDARSYIEDHIRTTLTKMKFDPTEVKLISDFKLGLDCKEWQRLESTMHSNRSPAIGIEYVILRKLSNRCPTR